MGCADQADSAACGLVQQSQKTWMAMRAAKDGRARRNVSIQRVKL
jgi:hypothetical protein